MHRFQYPGTYVVTVHGHYKRQTYVGRHEITVLPVTVSLTRNSDGDLQIHNDSPYEIDLSNYQVAGTRSLTLPANTILLANQTITIPGYRIGGSVTMHDDMSKVLASEVSTNARHAALAVSALQPLASQSVRSQSVTTPVSTSVETTSNSVVSSDALIQPEPEIFTIPAAEAATDVATASAAPTNTRWPYGLAAILLGIVSLVLLTRNPAKEPER
jgi:hypothetical protein